jgi:hypothetical protein
MSKLSDELSKLKSVPMDDEEDDMPESKPSSDMAEISAMKLFMKADTAEAKARALKKFFTACGY